MRKPRMSARVTLREDAALMFARRFAVLSKMACWGKPVAVTLGVCERVRVELFVDDGDCVTLGVELSVRACVSVSVTLDVCDSEAVDDSV